MNTNLLLAIAVLGMMLISYSFNERISSLERTAKLLWDPKIGDKVQSHYGGSNFVTTITNVVHVGDRSQSGLLVYGDGLPGVDSWWVKPAP